MEVSLRPATDSDVNVIYAWLNDAATRAASFQSEMVPYDSHVRWFGDSLARSDRHLYMAEVAGQGPVAIVRFDRVAEEPGCAEISINVSPEQRGRGVGVAALRAATATARGLGIGRILAFMRPDNEASRRAFERAGYTRIADREVRGVAALCWALELH
jgi:RimJ/RimL family protein N-acetyltransferase